jgi:hypothetical protein
VIEVAEMNLTISLPPEIEGELLKHAAEQSTDVSGFVLDAVQKRLSEIHEVDGQADLSYEDWKKEFDAWIARQKSRNPSFDDSRDSIYE